MSIGGNAMMGANKRGGICDICVTNTLVVGFSSCIEESLDKKIYTVYVSAAGI